MDSGAARCGRWAVNPEQIYLTGEFESRRVRPKTIMEWQHIGVCRSPVTGEIADSNSVHSALKHGAVAEVVAKAYSARSEKPETSVRVRPVPQVLLI